jgi:hypothetical protein
MTRAKTGATTGALTGARGLALAMVACIVAAAVLIWLGDGLLDALGAVGIAGAGALVATKGTLRRAVGVLLVVTGAGAVAYLEIASVLCGLVVAAAGVLAIRFGRDWPAMGARYDRTAHPVQLDQKLDMWDAMDRGEDPTTR